MKLLLREYASVAGCLEANRKACVVDRPHVSTLPLTSRGTEVESKRGAERVEDGSIVLRLGTVKMLGKGGNQTVLKLTEKFGNVTGQVGKMRVADLPRNPRKQTMRNSIELAKSRRHLKIFNLLNDL